MTFADGIRASSYTREELADLIEDLLVLQDETINGSLRSTTSASFVTLSNAQVTVTPESGQIVLIHFWVRFSHSVADDGIVLNIYRNSTTDILTEGPLATTAESATNGNIDWCGGHLLDTGQSGSTDYDIRFARVGSGGTVYVGNSHITAIVLTES